MIKKRLLSIALVGLLGSSWSLWSQKSTLLPVDLTCEHMTNPPVVDQTAPRLSWINSPTQPHLRNESQKAYRLCVASSREKLLKGEADVWDSGRRESSQSVLINYEGAPLQSGKEYWWRVMVWNSNNSASRWSEPARWGMGLLSNSEWHAGWIGAPWQGEAARKETPNPAEAQKRKNNSKTEPTPRPYYPAPLFRKSFEAKGEIVSAKAFVTGLGYFELYLNGKKVGNDCLVPNMTDYTVREGIKYTGISIDTNIRNRRVMYLAYDLTAHLRKGKNVAGAIVGDGFYDCTSRWVESFGSPRLLCQIEIVYKDGTKQRIVTDPTWKVKESPIVMNGVFDGEIYDATKEIAHWASPLCDDSQWSNAILRQPPTGKLTAHTAPTDKVVEELRPISLKKLDNGSYEVDFGVEISGWIQLKNIQGRRGDTLDVKYICESPLGVQRYIFKGERRESYAPRFTWYVFSKAIIRGIDKLTPQMLTAQAVNTDVPVTAEFRTSNPLFNKINTIWQRSQLDNMHGGTASDCPHRERSAYTGDGQVACVTVMHNFNAAAFYAKWIRDIADAQNIETGYVPNGAPWQPGCGGGVGWGAAMNIMPWEFYLHYGDTQMLKQHYLPMKEQVRYMLTWLTPEGTMFAQRCNLNSDQPNYWLNLGDWVAPYKNPSEELVHTFYLWRCADFTARAAKALGQTDDERYYSSLARKTKEAFHNKFYNKNEKSYGDYGSNIFALTMGVPKEREADVVNTLKQEITVKYNGHLNTGIFATQFFFETLAAYGLNDVAYEAMNKRDFPGFGHWIEQGATTTWEQWDGANSRNHPMFGGSLTWFYRTLAGVYTHEEAPGYRHIVIKPLPTPQLNEVYYANITPYGKVSSEVKQTAEGLEMNITVPVGSSATIHIPATPNSSISENGTPLSSVQGVQVGGSANGYQTVEVGQGTYRFAVKR